MPPIHPASPSRGREAAAGARRSGTRRLTMLLLALAMATLVLVGPAVARAMLAPGPGPAVDPPPATGGQAPATLPPG
jgi:hypothetical protein